MLKRVSNILNYSTINRRINRLNIKIKDTDNNEFKDDYIIIAIDSNGIKVIKRSMNEIKMKCKK